MGKMLPQNQVFGFHSARMEFFMEKTYKQYLVSHSPQFVIRRLLFLKNGHVPQKLFFTVIFIFFFLNCSMKNI